MRQIFTKRQTKRGVRTFLVLDNDVQLYIIFSDLDKNTPVFKSVSTFEAQDSHLAKLLDKGYNVQIRGFSSSKGSEESYLQRAGVSSYEEVEF